MNQMTKLFVYTSKHKVTYISVDISYISCNYLNSSYILLKNSDSNVLLMCSSIGETLKFLPVDEPQFFLFSFKIF